MTLPPIREDLEMFEGPVDKKGAPTYTIFDPLRSMYFKITWREYLLLQCFKKGMTLEALYKEVSEKTMLAISKEEIANFFQRAYMAELTASKRKGEELYTIYSSKKTLTPKTFMGTYFFIKFHFFNPDRFLSKTLKYVKPLTSFPAWIVYAFSVLLGIISLSLYFDDYIKTFTDFFNFKGVLAYAGGVIVMKTIHEFSHAYTAKNYGVHVYSMGAALMFFFPVLYTDVTHGWRLKSRKKRILISAAGSISELIIGFIAVVLWRMSPEGIWKGTFFVISSLAFFSVFFNLNPALRWDGYYILCDLWGIDNLRARADRYVSWNIRISLFGIDLPDPEPELSQASKAGLLVFIVYSWIFRFFIMMGIATFLYVNFTKFVGVVLIIFAAMSLIILPIFDQVKFLYKMHSHIKWNSRLIIMTLMFAALILWLVFPWPHFISFPAITTASEEQWVHVPFAGTVQRIYIERGMQVYKGQPLIKIYSLELENELEQKQTEAEQLRIQIRVFQQIPQKVNEIARLKTELDSVEAQIKSLQEMQEDYTLRASLDGQVIEWKRELKVGNYVAQGEVLGYIALPGQLIILAFVPERSIHDVKIGKKVLFRPYNAYPQLEGRIENISKKSTKILEYPGLATLHKGELHVVPTEKMEELKGLPEEGIYKLTKSYYLVEISVNGENKYYPFHVAGDIRYKGPWKSYLVEGIKHLISLLRQEISP